MAQTTINAVDARQRREFGGFNFGAAFFGWLVANSVAILLIALLSALGSAVALTVASSPNQLAQKAGTVGITGAILLLISIGIAYFAGGYVAGRMSRFDGGRQGFGVWVIGFIVTLILGLLGALLGSNYNLLQRFDLPSIPVDGRSFTTAGIITLVAMAAVSLATAIAGGKVGERYHRKVDRLGPQPA